MKEVKSSLERGLAAYTYIPTDELKRKVDSSKAELEFIDQTMLEARDKHTNLALVIHREATSILDANKRKESQAVAEEQHKQAGLCTAQLNQVGKLQQEMNATVDKLEELEMQLERVEDIRREIEQHIAENDPEMADDEQQEEDLVGRPYNPGNYRNNDY